MGRGRSWASGAAGIRSLGENMLPHCASTCCRTGPGFRFLPKGMSSGIEPHRPVAFATPLAAVASSALFVQHEASLAPWRVCVAGFVRHDSADARILTSQLVAERRGGTGVDVEGGHCGCLSIHLAFRLAEGPAHEGGGVIGMPS